MTPPLRITAEIGAANITMGAFSTFLDVTDRCFSFAITRGRTDYTRPFSAGTGTFTFRNLDGFFDPDAPTGLARGVKPGRRVEVVVNPDTVNERIIYTGLTTDITLSYDISGQATCTFTTADSLSLLAQQEINDGTAFSAQTTRERFDAVLALPEVDYPFNVVGSSGLSSCEAGTASGNALTYLNKVITTEQGAFFVERQGNLLFRNRHDVLQLPTVTFSDDGNDTSYEAIERAVTSTEIYNRLQANREGETPLIKESTTGANRFGIRFLNLGEVLFPSDAEVQDLLDFAIVKYASSQPRVSSVTTILDDKTTPHIAALTGLELTDSVRVEFTPPGTTAIAILATVEQISHQCTVGGKWLVTYGLAPRGDYFVLDDAQLGRLDFNALAL